MGRAMVVNAAQLASYSQAKQALLETGKTTAKCKNIQIIYEVVLNNKLF